MKKDIIFPITTRVFAIAYQSQDYLRSLIMLQSSNIKQVYLNNENTTRSNKFFMLLFVILQIQFIDKTISRELRWSKEFLHITPFLICLFIFLYVIIIKRKPIDIKSLIFAYSIIAITFTTILINKDYSVDNFIFILIVLIAFFISHIFKRDNYLQAYLNAMIFYCIYSLFATYFINPIIMETGIDIFPVYIGNNDAPYTDMGFAYVIQWIGVLRNRGYFNEPGVFQFYILVAISIEYFYFNRKTRRRNLFIFLVTLISTFSAAGLASAMFLVIGAIVKGRGKINWKVLSIVVIFIVSLLFLIISNDAISDNLNHMKMKIENPEDVSAIARYEGIINQLKMSMHNPFFGNSFVNGNLYILKNYSSSNVSDITGTLISFVMALGYPLGLWICFNFLKFSRILSKNDPLITLFIFLALFASSSSQNLIYDSLFLTLCFIPFMKVEKRRSENGR